MPATIRIRGVEPIVRAARDLIRANIDDYLAGVEALWTGADAIELKRPFTESYYFAQKGKNAPQASPAVFLFADDSRTREENNAHVYFVAPNGGHQLSLVWMQWHDDSEILRLSLYRVSCALHQMFLDNYRLNNTVDYIRVTDIEYAPAFRLVDANNVLEQSVQLTLLAETEEDK